MIEAHTPAADVRRVAAAAGVRRLVLSHFVAHVPLSEKAARYDGPAGIDEPQHWLEGVREHFRGEVVVGEDMMEIVDFGAGLGDDPGLQFAGTLSRSSWRRCCTRTISCAGDSTVRTITNPRPSGKMSNRSPAPVLIA